MPLPESGKAKRTAAGSRIGMGTILFRLEKMSSMTGHSPKWHRGPWAVRGGVDVSSDDCSVDRVQYWGRYDSVSRAIFLYKIQVSIPQDDHRAGCTQAETSSATSANSPPEEDSYLLLYTLRSTSNYQMHLGICQMNYD
eukprot:scaffold8274_cov136-Isochrysis_galbana.AAC.2